MTRKNTRSSSGLCGIASSRPACGQLRVLVVGASTFHNTRCFRCGWSVRAVVKHGSHHFVAPFEISSSHHAASARREMNSLLRSLGGRYSLQVAGWF